MGFSTNDKRAWTKRIFRKSVSNSVSFKTQLETDLDAAVDSIAGGQIASVSGNGLSTTFASSGMSPVDAQQLLNVLDDLYVEAKADLVTQGTASPTDTQIRDEMLRLLYGRKRQTADFSNIRG